MKKYLFEEIPLAVPSGLAEMKSVFSQMLDGSGQSVISFINPEIFLAQEKNPLLHEYFRSAAGWFGETIWVAIYPRDLV